MNDKEIHIKVYDGDDNKQYILFDDFREFLSKRRSIDNQRDLEIERLNNTINKTSKKLEMTLNCIKDYMVENEEYIKIHTDYIYALEEQINILKGVDKE